MTGQQLIVYGVVGVAAVGAGVWLSRSWSARDDATREHDTASNVATVVADLPSPPRVEEYDPIARMRVTGYTPQEVFQEEDRDEQWAARYERKLREQAERDLAVSLPEAEILSLTCRSSSCQVVVAAPERFVPNLMMAFPLPALADLGAMDPSLMHTNKGRAHATYTLLLRPEHRDEAAYDRWYSARRAEMLRGIAASGGLPNNKPLPRE